MEGSVVDGLGGERSVQTEMEKKMLAIKSCRKSFCYGRNLGSVVDGKRKGGLQVGNSLSKVVCRREGTAVQFGFLGTFGHKHL